MLAAAGPGDLLAAVADSRAAHGYSSRFGNDAQLYPLGYLGPGLAAVTLPTPRCGHAARSGEDDLAADREGIELADGDDVLDLVDEVIFGEPEQVAGCLAAVDAGAGVGDHLDEFRDRRDVELAHLAFQVAGHQAGHAGQGAGEGREVQARVADRGHLDVLVALLADRVEAEEGEEHTGFDTLGAGAVGHDQRRVDALKRAFGDNDRDFLDAGVHDRTILSVCSDAAAWLGNPGDPRGGLGRSLGEQLVQLLDGHARGLAEDADRGTGPLGLVFGAHEPDDLPVPRRQLVDAGRLGDLWRHVLAPLGRIDEETLVVDGDAVAGVGSGRHRQHLLRVIIGDRRRRLRPARGGGSCRGRAWRN